MATHTTTTSTPMTRAPSSPPPAPARDWEQVQSELGDLLGEEGVVRRREGYADYFLGFGKEVRIGEGCRFHHPDRIVLDDDVRMNVGALIYGSGGVRIGRHARIGPRVFIHSANHEVDPHDDRAFFERGYEYKSVEIGDNCLLSANVSILPGARIANGVFVACGAVVIKGDYPDGCRILGVPGRIMTPESSPAISQAPAHTPSIAFIVPRASSHREAAEVLVESLGLPQVCVRAEGEAMPNSVHSAIALGPPGWTPKCEASALQTWTLSEAEVSMAGVIAVTLPSIDGATGSHQITLPGSQLHVVVPAVDRGCPALENAAGLSLYYAGKRLRKRQSKLNTAERLEIHIALGLLCTMDGAGIVRLASEWAAALPVGRDQMTVAEHRYCAELAKAKSSKLRAHLADVIFDLAKMSDPVRKSAHKSIGKLTPVAVLGCPELPAAVALRDSRDDWRAIADAVSVAIPTCTKTAPLAALGAAAVFAGDQDIFDAVVKRLLQPDMFDSRSMCVRSAAGGDANSYSPIMATLLLLAMRRQQPGWMPRLITELKREIAWRVFRGEEETWRAAGADVTGIIVDEQRRLISRSLLDNWLACLRVPSLNGAPYELLEHNYEPLAAPMEMLWLALLRRMQHAAGRPLIRLKPWPYGCKAALSLRYDIDRNTVAAQVRDITDIQSERVHAACGSWYAIPGTLFGERLAQLLPLQLQEVGVHALSPNDAIAAQGVTCHSGPTSEYWRGEETIAGFERRGAAYAEMLATQLCLPRRAWIGAPGEGRATTMPLIPIHFPLEGSTNETTLEYFDRLLAHFHKLIDAGGHVIIGSHPDVNQSILRELLRRENVADVWHQPICNVVDRCMKVRGCGNISWVDDSKLLSRHTLADVHVEIDAPGEPLRSICIQLNAGVARTISA